MNKMKKTIFRMKITVKRNASKRLKSLNAET